MPTPIGHALGGFIAGWLVAGAPAVSAAAAAPAPAPTRRQAAVRALAFAGVGLLPDLDLLVNRHSQFTHSLGAVLVVMAAAAVLLRRRGDALTLVLAVGAAYASHPLLDWLGEDSTAPRGITALWPFSREYFLSHADIFLGISRRPWLPGALWHDTLAVLREVVLLAPLAAAAWWVRRRSWQILPRRPAAGRQQLAPRERLRRTGESAGAE